jgi:hypothetical protein
MRALLSILILVNLGAAQAQEPRAVTGSIRGAITATGQDGQSYNIPGASLKLKGTAQVAEAASDDAGEYCKF